ncbi:MAG: PrgI family protein [bacterium]
MPTNEEQTAHRQHPVPQNIMSVEFKLVGDLTVRQFVYLVIGGITVYLSFISKLPFLWKWSLILFSGFGSLALAFVPFGDRGLDQWIKNFIKSITTPTQRVWRKTLEPPEYFLSDYAESVKREVVALAPAKSRRAITSYLENSTQPTRFPIDKKEEDFFKRINFDIDIPKNLKSVVSVKTLPKTEIIPKSFTEKVETKKIQKQYTPVESNISRALKHIPLEGEIVLPKRIKKVEVSVLPVKEVSDEEHRKELLKKAVELREALKRAKEKFTPEGAVLPANELVLGEEKGTVLEKEKQLQEVANALRKENKILFSEINSLKTQMQGLDKTKETYKTQLSVYEKRIKDLEEKKDLVEETIQTKIVEPSSDSATPNPNNENIEIVKKLSDAVTKETKNAEYQKRKVIEPVSVSPNVIWGTVKDKNGHLLENATLIIRDENDTPIRALKTNKLGQFMGATPLNNGNYKIEVLNNENSFDIIKVSLTGKAVKPLEFLTKNK